MPELLEVKNLVQSYGKKVTLRDISINVQQGEIVGIVGHNGAGKTTMLGCILGLLPIKSGAVFFNGKDMAKFNSSNRVKQGICLVPQGKGVFSDLSVMDNLRTVALLRKNHQEKESISEALEFFPALKTRTSQLAGSLSGGERQMLSVAMSLVARPTIIMLDEPSIGLSPFATEEMLRRVKEINQKIGCAVLIAEENIYKALSIANRVYVIKLGEIILDETAEKLSQRNDFWELF